MAVDFQLEELQLPAELLDDLFFVDGERNAADKAGEEDVGDPLAGLARQMVRPFIRDDEGGVFKMGATSEQRRWSLHGRGYPGQPRKLCPGKYAEPFLSLQQLQAARIFHLKQQQVVQQQLYAAWERQCRARAAAFHEASRRSRHFVLPYSGCVTSRMQHQQQQPHTGSEMRAVFIPNSGARKESVGTGVFLPRPSASKDKLLKKSARSTVLIPARVVLALNLNKEALGAQGTTGFPGRFVLQNDAIRTPIGTPPQEWTY